MIDQTVVVFASPVTSTANSAAAILITGVPQALMKMYSLDCSELETSRKCSWRAVLSNNKSLLASSLHSVNVCEGLIFGGLSDEQTVQTANNTKVEIRRFAWRGQDDRQLKIERDRKSVSLEINYAIRFVQVTLAGAKSLPDVRKMVKV
ncbi:Hypothetical predicted protein [Paramuricea clavata]|uniref:Uncharacterized protein n=1 Tax=Paramuricea clavata TaxID=317549 RepID=A0A6S7I778_PARCT|nr:Hypothetical predicted protein [Paramuricea clavata]